MLQPIDILRIKLTENARSGGCGCKISPGVLSRLPGESTSDPMFRELHVGTEYADDVAVYGLYDSQTLVDMTDFFMPVMDGPFDFMRAAATRAISDICAVDAVPVTAHAVVGAPVNELPIYVNHDIPAGEEPVCRDVGIANAGGRSVTVAW